MSRCGPNKITLLVGAPKHDQRTMCVPAVRTNRYMMAGRLAAGAAAAVASSSAAASDMAVGSVYIIYKYWGRVLEQHVLPHGRAPTAPDGANFQTEKWTVFQVQQLHPSKYIYNYRLLMKKTAPVAKRCSNPCLGGSSINCVGDINPHILQYKEDTETSAVHQDACELFVADHANLIKLEVPLDRS